MAEGPPVAKSLIKRDNSLGIHSDKTTDNLVDLVPVLPLEVFELIIDHFNFYPDNRTLCACSLVCRNFVHRCRTRLFCCISIHKKQTVLLLAQVFRLSHIRPYFACIRVIHVYNPFLRPLRDEIAYLLPILFSTGLSTVVELHISNGGWQHLPSHLAPAMFIHFFSSVTLLQVSNSLFSSFRDFQRLICTLPQLSRLYLYNIEWPHTEQHCQTQLGRSLRLKELHISWIAARLLLEWLCITPSMETLRSVYIFHIKIPTQPLTRFFAQLRTLNELDMDYDNDSTVNKLPDGTWPISEHLQHLASIRINMGPNWLDEGCISGLGSFFESLSTRCLQYVTLEIRFSHLRGEKQNQDIGEWVNIDKALSRKMFQSIQKVRVEWTGKIHGKVDGLEVCRQIEAKFPALQKCGCLEVRVLSFDEWAPGFGDRAK